MPYHTRLAARTSADGNNTWEASLQRESERAETFFFFFSTLPRQAAAAIMTTSALRDDGPAHPPAGPSVCNFKVTPELDPTSPF